MRDEPTLYTAWVRHDLAKAILAQGRDKEAKELFLRALPGLEKANDLQPEYRDAVRLLREIEQRAHQSK